MNLDGFRVVSQFDVEQITCEDLKQELYQLAIILYPSDSFNEKFLIKMRDCVVKLGEDHPLKVWLKWVSAPVPLTKAEQEKASSLVEIVNSQFNLITDLATRNKVIELLSEIPENTLYEKILKSQLYLIIGNVTRSDNMLKEVVNRSPLENWKGYAPRPSQYHRLSKSNIEPILERLARHPADRKIFDLFDIYLSTYMNDPLLKDMASDLEHEEFKKRLAFEHTQRLAPSFVNYLRLKRLSGRRQMEKLRQTTEYPVEEQIYWIWPFLESEPVLSQALVMELDALHDKDLLWFIYLMDDEKLADMFRNKTGKSFLHGRRQYLRSKLSDDGSYMLALYKLIEFGDIDQDLIRKTLHFLRHE